MTKIIKLLFNKRYLIATVGVFLIIFFAHSYNMFKYPYYENDEGIYMSQAWAVITKGEMSPYTYWYDHAPAGWILIAAWTKISGGFNTFGLSINSGRVFITLLYLASSFFIFYIIKRYTSNKWASLLGVLVFGLSPLAIYYQRRVLLDNIMIFWVLWSLVILLKAKISTWQYYLSAILFAIAILTKESALMFFPAFIYLILWRYPFFENKRRIVSWIALVVLIIGLYPLYAWSQGELWKNSSLNGERHISLIETLQWQASRGNGTVFFKKGSEFRLAWQDWIFRDPFFIWGGFLICFSFVMVSLRKKSWRVITLMMLGYLFFLFRGGIVLNFYIIPLIPLIAIASGLIFHKVQSKKTQTNKIFLGIIVGIWFLLILQHSTRQYYQNDTEPQKNIIEWIKNNLPADSRMAIDDYGWVDYHTTGFVNDKVFDNAHVFWKIEKESAIKDKIFHNDWFRIQYIASSDTLENLLSSNQLKLVKQAYIHSEIIKKWGTENGYHTELRKIKSQNTLKKRDDLIIKTKREEVYTRQLQESWRAYKNRFIHNYGQVIDPNTQTTTSEGQSYAMLRSVWMNDEDTFMGVWQWTKDHFQFRNNDKLLSWKWQNDKLADFNNATDADEDIALALIFAYNLWDNEEYLASAKEILKSIWEECVVEINGRYYLLPINHNIATQWNGYLFNPSYLSPAWYRIFAKFDQEHNWNKLAEDSYWILHKINNIKNNKTGLPINWAVIENETGKIISAKEFQGKEADYFGFDAFRIFWRVALDEQWFQSQEASDYLRETSTFLVDYYKQNAGLPMLVRMDGEIINSKSSIAIDSGCLAVFMEVEDVSADIFYQKHIQSFYNQREHFWQNPNDYYGNNWAWFATALYNGDLKNIN